MQRRTALFILIAACVLGAPSCSTNPATGEQSFTAFMSPQEEKRVGADQHPQLVEQFGGEYTQAGLNAYVDRIGQALAQHAEIKDIRYSFTVLDDDGVNAFALPGGYVHVTRGLLALASNEAELAGVLGHEIGHVTARHAAQRYSAATATSIGIGVLGVLGTIAGIPQAMGDLASSGLQTGAQVYLQSYSRDQELQADQLGIRYMTEAGYDPDAMVSFFRKLDAFARLEASEIGDPGAADRFDIMASHPRTADRVQQAAVLAQKSRAPGEQLDRDRYLEQIDGLVYGDSPAQGVRRGREFAHPGLRFAFKVPQGFILQNNPQQVVAVGPQNSMIVFDADGSAQAKQAADMQAYLTRVWASKAQVSSVESFTVDQMPAATGITRARLQSGTFDARLVAIRGTDRVWRFVFLTPPQLTSRFADDFKRTAYSFRRLSAEEAAAIKPLRIKVVTVADGDTQETLAEKMVLDSYKIETFRVLNGLSASDRLTPGQLVKIVAG